MAAMKWWGWGREDVAFTHEDKPGLARFLHEDVGVDVSVPAQRPPAFADLDGPAPALPDELRAGRVAGGGEDSVSTDALDRVLHGRGKSLRDLVRQRRGDLGRLPDVVVWPAGEDQVGAVLTAALAQDAVVIPFGGGSSISGSLEAPAQEGRPVISLDLA